MWLHGGVFVDIAGHAECREALHFLGVGNGPAEDDNRRAVGADRSQRLCTRSIPRRAGAADRGQSDRVAASGREGREKFVTRPHRHCAMAGPFEGRPEPVPDKSRVIGDEHRLDGDQGRGGHRNRIGTVGLPR